MPINIATTGAYHLRHANPHQNALKNLRMQRIISISQIRSFGILFLLNGRYSGFGFIGFTSQFGKS
jgi:hypothetical protein